MKMKRINITIDYPHDVDINADIFAEALNRGLKNWEFSDTIVFGFGKVDYNGYKLEAESVVGKENGRYKFVGINLKKIELTEKQEGVNEES
jgi:hypothetical protein